MEKVRVDKWLWSVRIFKSRTLASEACKDGKVKMGDERLKPSSLISIGEHLEVQKNGFNYRYEIVHLLQKRVSASIAQQAYLDHTPQEELNKYKDWYIGKGRTEIRERGSGRPTKKDRRVIDEFKKNPE